MDNRQVAVTPIGTESKLFIGIKSVCVHAFTNGWCGNHLAAIGIRYSHHLIAASGKQPAVFLVHRQPAWLFTGGKRPGLHHRRLLGINARQLALVFNIYIDHAFAIGCAEFWLAVKRNIANHLVIRGIDYRGIFAAAIKGKHALSSWVIENSV